MSLAICSACGEPFASDADFDRHRVGPLTRERRCLTVAEMEAGLPSRLGRRHGRWAETEKTPWRRNAYGRWTTREAPPDQVGNRIRGGSSSGAAEPRPHIEAGAASEATPYMENRPTSAPTQAEVTALLADVEHGAFSDRIALHSKAIEAAKARGIPDHLIRQASRRGRARMRAASRARDERALREQEAANG